MDPDERLATLEYSIALLSSIEANAEEAATNLDQLMGCLEDNLKEITSLSINYSTSYKSAACNVNYAVNDSVDSTRQFLDQCLVLHKELASLEALTQQITDIKKALNRFEYFTDQVLSGK